MDEKFDGEWKEKNRRGAEEKEKTERGGDGGLR